MDLTCSQWFCWRFNSPHEKLQMNVIHKEKPITVWGHKPKKWDKHSPVVFVMHGIKRDAQKYWNLWIKHSERQNFLLLVPEFSNQHYPGIIKYNLGNTFSSLGEPIAKSTWTYTIIERIFDAAKTIMKFRTNTYNIYGHSAGAQFVHRLAIFLPEARFDLAICANAGWYTLPSYTTKFPYGLKASGITETELKKAFGKKVVILLGDKDINPRHKYLNKSPQAKAQGKHRYERGRHFYEVAKREAEKLHVPLKWELVVVRGVGHNNARMAKRAIENLWY